MLLLCFCFFICQLSLWCILERGGGGSGLYGISSNQWANHQQKFFIMFLKRCWKNWNNILTVRVHVVCGECVEMGLGWYYSQPGLLAQYACEEKCCLNNVLLLMFLIPWVCPDRWNVSTCRQHWGPKNLSHLVLVGRRCITIFIYSWKCLFIIFFWKDHIWKKKVKTGKHHPVLHRF